MRFKLFLSLIFVLFLSGSVSAFLISDQGTSVRNLTGSLLENGNLTITIYNNAIGGSLVFSSATTGTIVNGSWNLMINPPLEYGTRYWKDYEINGEDLDFDGNERLEFQSSVGFINNVSFFNFSLINSCPVGSAIRLIYLNGSVECETDDSGNGTADLTNYALKNQSETFAGNISTTYTGFFGFLGSLASRITKLFVNDIDASGNVNVTGNVTASYFKGDGSLLTNLPAGAESDPLFVAENSTLWSAINSKLAQTDQRYNETALINNVNQSLSLRIDGISGGNASWNQSLANTLYSAIIWNYNQTIPAINYFNSNPFAWLNVTTVSNATIARIGNCPAGQFVQNTTAGGVQCVTPSAGTESDPIWNANLTSGVSNDLNPLTNIIQSLGSSAKRWLKGWFKDLDVSNNISIGGNVSAQFYLGSLNRSTFPTSSCSGTDKATGVNANGSISCAADETGSSGQTIPVKFISVLAGAVTDTNAPAAERIVGNSQYLVCANTTGYDRFRYGFARSATNGGANAKIYMKYIDSPATTITGSSYTNLSNSSAQILGYTTANIANLSAYYTMDNNLGDICIGAFQTGGDGTLDPRWRNIWVELD